MSQAYPDETAVALPTSQQRPDEESEAEIQDRKRQALALLRQWRKEASEEDKEMWPLVKKEFNLL
jgi:hypothetical protein